MAIEDITAFVEKLKDPVVWFEGEDFRIEDIGEARYDKALKMIQKYYMKEDVLAKGVDILSDEVSTQAYLDRLNSVLKDSVSICTVSQETGKMVAVLLMKVFRKADFSRTYSHVKFVEGEKMIKILNISYAVLKRCDFYEKLNCDKVLRFYVLCVKPKSRKKGIGLLLMKTAMEVGRKLKVGGLIALFSAGRAQYIATKLGMKILNEIFYVDWIVNGEIVFEDPGAGNYTLALMGVKILPLQTDPDEEVEIQNKILS